MQDIQESYIVPILSIECVELNGHKPTTKDFENVPAYLENVVLNGHRVQAKGSLNGTQFYASLPSYWQIGGDPPKSKYLHMKFPKQSIEFFKNVTKSSEDPEYAVVYSDQGEESRDNAREKLLRPLVGICGLDKVKGRIILAGEQDIIKEDVKRLDDIACYFAPTLITLYNMMDSGYRYRVLSRGKSSIDSLVIPRNVE